MHRRTLNSGSRRYMIGSDESYLRITSQVPNQQIFPKSQTSKTGKSSLSLFLPFLFPAQSKPIKFSFLSPLSISPLMIYFRSFSSLAQIFPTTSGLISQQKWLVPQSSFITLARLTLAKYHLHDCALLITALLWLPL